MRIQEVASSSLAVPNACMDWRLPGWTFLRNFAKNCCNRPSSKFYILIHFAHAKRPKNGTVYFIGKYIHIYNWWVCKVRVAQVGMSKLKKKIRFAIPRKYDCSRKKFFSSWIGASNKNLRIRAELRSKTLIRTLI